MEAGKPLLGQWQSITFLSNTKDPLVIGKEFPVSEGTSLACTSSTVGIKGSRRCKQTPAVTSEDAHQQQDDAFGGLTKHHLPNAREEQAQNDGKDVIAFELF